MANTAGLKLGDNLGVHCFLKRKEYAPATITYLVGDSLLLAMCFYLYTSLHLLLCVHLSSQILSKGRLVKHSRRQLNHQIVISENILVTKEMMPSFTIIAYYRTSNNEVVSDSVRVDVKDTCIGSVRKELISNPRDVARPRV